MDPLEAAATVAPSPRAARSPYVGLRPYEEEDHEFFFGREDDQAIIHANIVAATLTVLYGPSGVGKSSLLRAGVLPRVRRETAAIAVYYNQWQRNDFGEALTRAVVQAVRTRLPGTTLPHDLAFDELLHQASKQTGDPVLVVLDQFEEYLLYHSEDAPFDVALARAVNRREVNARFLIGIREDALHRFDPRFRSRIPNPLGNTLYLRPLSTKQAEDAILEPLKVWKRRYGDSAGPTAISESTVDAVLAQLTPRPEPAGADPAREPATGTIETAYLQLVMEKWWDAERQAGSHELRVSTLNDRDKLGGADRIVYRHLVDVITRLPSASVRICESLFPHLVTPSRGKISHATGDLIAFAREADSTVTDAHVTGAIASLSNVQDRRILRRTFPPERFEIFHDVLATPILEWVSERQREREARRNFRRYAALLAVAVILGVAAVIFANTASRAKQAEAAALSSQKAAEDARADAQRVREEQAAAREESARGARLLQQALDAMQAGNKDLAAKLEKQASDFEKKSASRPVLTEGELAELQRLRKGATDAAERERELVAENTRLSGFLLTMRQDRDALQKRLDAVEAELKSLKGTAAGSAPAQQPPPQQQTRRPAVNYTEIDALNTPSMGKSAASGTASGSLLLTLVDQYGRPLKDRVKVTLRHSRLDDRREADVPSASGPILVTNLYPTGGDYYTIEMKPDRYLPGALRVPIDAGTRTERRIDVDLDIEKAKGVFPTFADLPSDLRATLQDSRPRAYEALSDMQKAWLLNIHAKLRTMTAPGRPFHDGGRPNVVQAERLIVQYLDSIIELRGDRLVCRFELELRDALQKAVASKSWTTARSSEKPPQGFMDAGTFRSLDRSGALTLTVFQSALRSSSAKESLIVHASIEAGDAMSRVMRLVSIGSNAYPHPYVIHQILWNQKIDTLYRLEP